MAKKEDKTFLEKINISFDKLLLGNMGIIAIFLVFGLVAYLKPYSMSLKSAQVVMGVYLILFGLFYCYEFLMRKEMPLFNLKVVLGVISLVLGLFVIINPFKIYEVITFTLGIYLSMCALYKIYEALKFRKLEFDGWLIMLVVSIILLVFGIFIGINPMKMMDLVEAAGIFIILASLLEACILVLLYTKNKEIKKLF